MYAALSCALPGVISSCLVRDQQWSTLVRSVVPAVLDLRIGIPAVLDLRIGIPTPIGPVKIPLARFGFASNLLLLVIAT